MTPKQRAEELIEKFTMDNTRDGERNGIKCALIAVDEIIKQFVGWYNKWKELHPYMLDVQDSEKYRYWQQVAKEIKES